MELPLFFLREIEAEIDLFSCPFDGIRLVGDAEHDEGSRLREVRSPPGESSDFKGRPSVPGPGMVGAK
jgi:hypothetical protein